VASAVVKVGKLVMKRYIQYSHCKPRLNWDEVKKLWPSKLLCGKCLLRKPKSETIFVAYLKICVGSTKIRVSYNPITKLPVYEPSWIYLRLREE
jgi:hypothetical protein